MILKAMRHFFWLAGAFYTLASTFLLSLFLSISNIYTCGFHQFNLIFFFLAPPQLSSQIPCSAAESAQNFNAFLYSWICQTSFQVCQVDVEDFLLIWDFVQATSSVHTSLPSLIALVYPSICLNETSVKWPRSTTLITSTLAVAEQFSFNRFPYIAT